MYKSIMSFLISATKSPDSERSKQRAPKRRGLSVVLLRLIIISGQVSF